MTTPHECICTAAGECPLHNRYKVQREVDICRGAAGVSPKLRQHYLEGWTGTAVVAKSSSKRAPRDTKKQAPPQPISCVHLGEKLSEEALAEYVKDTRSKLSDTGLPICDLCGARGTTYEVFACAKHGVCTQTRRHRKTRSCAGCPDREGPPTTPLPTSPFRLSQTLPKFISTRQLMDDVRILVSMLPPDVARVVGVARSGLCVATMVSMLIHRPLYALRQSLSDIVSVGSGWRIKPEEEGPGVTLVIDDTTMTGNSLRACRPIAEKEFQEVVTASVYCNPNARVKPDIYAVDLAWPHLLEWNLFNSVLSPQVATDFDGILCHDCLPGQDDDGTAYEEFLKTARPLHLSRRCKIPLIVTARLEKYRGQTLDWLERHGVACEELVMGPWQTLSERTFERVVEHKARHYQEFLKKRHVVKPPMFIESSILQAKEIAKITGGLVVCPSAEKCFS